MEVLREIGRGEGEAGGDEEAVKGEGLRKGRCKDPTTNISTKIR